MMGVAKIAGHGHKGGGERQFSLRYQQADVGSLGQQSGVIAAILLLLEVTQCQHAQGIGERCGQGRKLVGKAEQFLLNICPVLSAKILKSLFLVQGTEQLVGDSAGEHGNRETSPGQGIFWSAGSAVL